jgi:hypothetical protein
MIRDPFYREIIKRLNSPLDGDLFEDCAADLLRAIYPTLVPMRGGNDAGMDGAITNGEGEPFPLVCTTEKDVIGNLRRSLNSYLKNRRQRRKVVLATSQQLTPRRVRNLYDRAAKLGFSLVGVHTQEAIANLLYYSPHWCLELLNLSGTPSALSVVPRTDRPLLGQTLIGREADLAWLQQGAAGRLLVGQPGSGKTFLLHRWALEGSALFVVSTDRGEIATAIRSTQPPTIIVDDAQLYPGLLTDLKQLRHDMGAEFAILASCWPSDQEMVVSALNIPASCSRQLELLTRNEIVDVVKTTGLAGPDALVQEIVRQAEGRPGLAVTLANLCLQGGIREVALGDALNRALSSFFEHVGGTRVSAILAGFSVGGSAGMPMTLIAEWLDLSLADVRDAVVRLSTSGIVWDMGQDRLAVHPAALREVLVRDTFFSGAASLPIEPLLPRISSLESTTRTLIGARARGGAVPQKLLVTFLEMLGAGTLWHEFASLGTSEAVWVLENHPEQATIVATPALHYAPEKIIPTLLRAAVGDRRPLHATPEHPLRKIQDWVQGAYPGTGQVVRRRKALLAAAGEWLRRGDDQEVGLRAIQIALSPRYEAHTVEPGAEDVVVLHYGYPSFEEVRAIQELWTDVQDTLRAVELTVWDPVHRIIEDWAYPGRFNVTISPEMRQSMRAFAVRILQDIITLAQNRPGILHWVAGVARDIKADIEVPLNPDFEVLYPEEDRVNWKEAEERQYAAVQQLARDWSTREPIWVVQRIIAIEREAQSTGIAWPRWTPLICREIAQAVESVGAWIQVLLDVDSTDDMIGPFLSRAANVGEPGWIDWAIACLNRSTVKQAAVVVVLTQAHPPEDLLAETLPRLEGLADTIKILCSRGQVPEHLVKRLLRHPDAQIASAAAIGEWNADPKGSIRASLLDNWRYAVVHAVREDYHLGEMLGSDPVAAYAWLEKQLEQRLDDLWRFEKAVQSATNALDAGAKREILRRIPAVFEASELVALLIGDDLELYSEVLGDARLARFHLVPLSGVPEGIWGEKAKRALQVGYSAESIAVATYSQIKAVEAFFGAESTRWAEWVERFDRLCALEDESLKEIGRVGKGIAQKHREQALLEERHEAVYGLDWERT